MTNKIAAAIFGALLIVAAGMSLMKPVSVVPLLKFNIRPDLIVGEPVPSYLKMSCTFESMSGEYPFEECTTIDSQYRSYISINVQSNVVSGISYDANGTLAGDLLLAWGPPDTAQNEYGFITLYWGNKIAWAHASAFSPFTKINWVDFYPDDNYGKRFPKWRGFGSSALESK